MMTKKKVIGVGLAALLLSGCSIFEPNRSDGPPVRQQSSQIVSLADARVPTNLTVAAQALGNSRAFPINPYVRSRVSVPGIYAILPNGALEEICEVDMRAISAIRTMPREPEETFNETIADEPVPFRVAVSVAGENIALPVVTTSVDNYTVERIRSGSNQAAHDFILSNVEDECRNVVLPRNEPYIVVTARATGEIVRRSVEGGDFDIAVGNSFLGGRLSVLEQPARTARNRVFAVRGLVVGLEQD